jgi:hypothetical protein
MKAANPGDKKQRQQWVKDNGATNWFGNGGLFAIRPESAKPQGDFNMVRTHVCHLLFSRWLLVYYIYFSVHIGCLC